MTYENTRLKRFSMKSTKQVQLVMLAVADKRHKDISDLIYEYFYLLAVDDLLEITSDANAGMVLNAIFDEAMKL